MNTQLFSDSSPRKRTPNSLLPPGRILGSYCGYDLPLHISDSSPERNDTEEEPRVGPGGSGRPLATHAAAAVPRAPRTPRPARQGRRCAAGGRHAPSSSWASFGEDPPGAVGVTAFPLGQNDFVFCRRGHPQLSIDGPE